MSRIEDPAEAGANAVTSKGVVALTIGAAITIGPGDVEADDHGNSDGDAVTTAVSDVTFDIQPICGNVMPGAADVGTTMLLRSATWLSKVIS